MTLSTNEIAELDYRTSTHNDNFFLYISLVKIKLHDIKHNINMLVFYDLHPSQTKDFIVLAPRTFRRGTHAREKTSLKCSKHATTCYNFCYQCTELFLLAHLGY